MGDQVEDIVTHILQSPHLRNSVANAVRDATHRQSISVAPIPSTSVREELHRLFPTIRANSHQNVIVPNQCNLTSVKRSSRKDRHFSNTEFYRDIILLKSPCSLSTLRGPQKLAAFEEGFAFSNAKFNSEWNYNQISNSIRELFHKQLDGTPFEIMVPMSGRLIKPNLPPGIEFNAKTMKSMFNQKVVYIRPTINLPNVDTVTSASSKGEHCHQTMEEVIPDEVDTSPSVLCIGDTGGSPTMTEYVDIFKESGSNEDNAKEISLKSLIQNLNDQVTEESITIFNIYREDVFACCLRALRRSSFSPFNKISVKFSDIEGTSEGAVDAGGPTREMFRLVLNYVKNSRMFFGLEKKYIRLDLDAINKKHYQAAGQLIALAFIHGGNGPHFFSESFYSVLCSDIEHGYPTLDDIDDGHIRDVLKNMSIASDITNVQDMLDDPLFEIAGCNVAVKDMEHRDQLLQAVIHFYSYHRIRPALEQFREGLQTGMIFELIKSHPPIFKEAMCHDPLITAATLENLFLIEYSENGSTKRCAENRTISYWRDFLLECEDYNTNITLKSIMIFITGAEIVPPLGYSCRPTISFLHDNSLYPKANTCGLQVKLPTVHMSYDEFVEHIMFGIANCNDFAFA